MDRNERSPDGMGSGGGAGSVTGPLRPPDDTAPRPPEAGAATPTARVGSGFIALYTLAYLSTTLLFLAPVLVTLALKINSLVGIDQAPNSLALVAGAGALLAMLANPFFGMLSDRTASRFGMRRTWMVVGLGAGSCGILIVALAPNIAMVLVGWCIAQVFFNALLAAEAAVLADQVPPAQRGTVAGVLGVCVPVASVGGAALVNLFSGSQLAMFLAPCAVGGFFILLFASVLNDRRLDPRSRPAWSLREVLGIFYVSPRKNPDFAWAFASRFLFVLAYAFLVTFLAYFLIEELRSAEADVPAQILLGTLVHAGVAIVASVIGGRLSDRFRRRKVFVLAAAVVYGAGMFAMALAGDLNGFLIAMAIGGLGFGLYLAVDLALVVDVLPGGDRVAKNLGVLNIAGALPSSVAPAMAPLILAVSNGSYGVLYAVAGVCALLAALTIVPIRRVR
jgi:MFS family permease